MSQRFDTFEPPTPRRDCDFDPAGAAPEAEPADEGGELDPRTAAALLNLTTQRAERAFHFRTPLLLLIGALVALIAYGVLWLSVRHQHPYNGPTGTALAVLYSIVAVWVILFTTVRRRAATGVSGHSVRQRRLEGIAFAVPWVAIYVFEGALAHAGASHSIVYGIYPAAAPLIIIGGAAATHSAAKENWPWAAFALGAVAVGAIGAFTCPADVWAVAGIGLATLLAVRAVSQIWLRYT